MEREGGGIKGKLHFTTLTSYLFNVHHLYVGCVQTSKVVCSSWRLEDGIQTQGTVPVTEAYIPKMSLFLSSVGFFFEQ